MFNRRQFIEAAFVSSAAGAAPMCFAPRSGLKWRDAAALVDSIGVNTHFGQEQTPYVKAFDAVAGLIDALGVRNLREDLGGGVRVGRSAAQFERLRRLAAAGRRFSLVCFDGAPGSVYIPPTMTPAIRDWCDGAVDFLEGPNEPSIGRGADAGMRLLNYQKDLYQTVRGTPDLRDVKVLGPSFTPSQVVFARSMAELVDFGNIHPYPGHLNPETSKGVASLRRYLNVSKGVFGDKKFVVTESGYHTALETKKTHLPVPEALKARYLPRLVLWYFKSGIQRTYIYEAVSSFARGHTDPESSFGLAGNDLRPTPSYNAIKNLISLFQSAAPRAAPPLTAHVSASRGDLEVMGFQRRDGVRLIALWRRGEGWDAHSKTIQEQEAVPVTLRLDGRPRRVLSHRFEDDGNLSSAQVALSTGALNMKVDDRLTVFALS